MNLETAILITTHIFTCAMVLAGIEMFLISRTESFMQIWSYANLKVDLESGLPLSGSLIAAIFSHRAFQIASILQIAVGAFGFFFPGAITILILLFLHLYFCMRFRGTFNGGSDMMAFVVLTGLLIAWISPNDNVRKLGLIYIAIHAIYSYFKAGIAKARSPDWVRGDALGRFLARSLLVDTRKVAAWLGARPTLGKVLCWGVIAFELLALVIPFSQPLTSWYFLCAIVFHFVIYLSFGLNRFFWMWGATWPSILYSVSLIK